MSQPALWIFVLTATASDCCIYPAGEKHAILAAAVGRDDTEAEDRVEAALAELHWTQPLWSRSGRVDRPEAAPEGTLRDTAAAALRDGCALIIYPDSVD